MTMPDKAASGSLNTSTMLAIATGILLMLTSCALQDNVNVPQNYSPTVETNVTQNATINTTVSPPPVDNILLPLIDGIGIYILDNIDGNSAIVTLNGKSMLINAPPLSDGLRTLRTINNLGIKQLDYLILQNNHDKNIGGASSIILRKNPIEVIHTGIPSSTMYYQQYNSLDKNYTVVPKDKVISFDEAIVSLIVPYDDEFEMTSDSEIVVKVEYGGFSTLFMGDCGSDCESRIGDLFADVIVSSGGCGSLSLSFLQIAAPDMIVFISSPCSETSERVKSLNILTLYTVNDGDIVLTSNGDGYQYSNLKTRVS